MPKLAQSPLLDIGSDLAAVAGYAAQQWGRAVYLHTDLVACRRASNDERLTVLHADVLPEEQYRTVVIDSTVFDGIFALEMALGCVKNLTPDGALLLALPTQYSQEKWYGALKSAFRRVSISAGVAIAKQPIGKPSPPEEYMFHINREGRDLTFRSGPGVFSPRAFDQGTQAMLELVTPPDRDGLVLDLGCGTGVVSVVAATSWRCRVLAVDTNARALHFTKVNVAANGVDDLVEVRASDGFSDVSKKGFDLVISNPPYHTDYAVAKKFIEGSVRRLRVGGSLWVVVKKADWYRAKMRSVFGGCRVFERNGYCVLMAERREPTTDKRH